MNKIERSHTGDGLGWVMAHEGVASNDQHLAPEHGTGFNPLDRRMMGKQDESQRYNTRRQQ